MQTYKVKDISKTLNAGESTIRRWMQKLSDAGYPWLLSEQGYRYITERDIIALRSMNDLLTRGITLDEACSEIVATYGHEERAVPSLREQDMRVFDELKSLRDEIAAMRASTERMEERTGERDKLLMEVLAELREQKKKRKWWRFFK